MKKLVFASVVALAGIGLVTASTLRAQDSGQITISDPAEFNAYQNASTQSDPAAKASALESFLTNYPQSVVKKAVLDQLIDAYQGARDSDKALSAASRLLQLDPGNVKAIFISVYIKRQQCLGKSDPQTCDDAAALAQKGLDAPKPAATSDDDWKKLTGGTYPTYDSAIALDDAVSKKDDKSAEDEYRKELMLFPPEATQSGMALVDTLNLAAAYAKPDSRDMVLAVWFYARAWNFAPPAYKAQIEPQLEYWYKRFHGTLDGLDAVKTQAATTLFPPADFKIAPAPTPSDLAHTALTTTPDLTKLNLEDKEFILANGVKEDADKLWAVLKDQQSPVPGIVIEATASTIKIAVTQDAKDNKVADFIVNLKTPLKDADIPAAGFEYKLQPAAELDGTYDTYTQIPAAGTTAASAQIVLREGFVQPEKKAAPVHHHPATTHHTTTH